MRGIYLSLQSINDVQRSNGLSLGMFSISDCITNNSLKEDFEDASGFFVDEAGDTFNATTTSETTDCGFGDALYAVSPKSRRYSREGREVRRRQGDR